MVLSPRGLNEGDGLRMAMERGAAVANLGEAWWTLAVRLRGEGATPQEELRFLSGPRSLPGSILVNRRGRRFVNEAVNYHDIVRAFHVFEPGAFAYPNRPAWFVFGEAYRRTHGLLSAARDAPTPGWLEGSATLEALAARCEIDPGGLRETVERFDEQAANGLAPDSAAASLPTTSPPATRPGRALRARSARSARRPTTRSRSTSPRSARAAGCARPWRARSWTSGQADRGPLRRRQHHRRAHRTGYAGGGGTIGPALTFGYLAGRAAAGAAPTP